MSNLTLQALDDHMRENGDPEGAQMDGFEKRTAVIACNHKWKMTSQRALGMWCVCAKCGATKEETWD